MTKSSGIDTQKNDNADVKNKIGTSALSMYLNEGEDIQKKIAVSALSFYLQSKEEKNITSVIAQAALALYFDNNPLLEAGTQVQYPRVQQRNSAWNNKILMMRQIPIRK